MTRLVFLLFSPIFSLFCWNSSYSQNSGLQSNDQVAVNFPKKEVVVINSGFAEARPLISFDGNALYFNRRHHPENVKGEKDFQDVWVSYLDTLSGEWTTPKNLGPVINNKKRNAIASLSPDGMDGIFFNTYKNTKRMPLVRSRKSGDSWTKPQVLRIDNFVNVSDYSDYFVDFENRVLILAIQADSTVGDQDLYVSFPDSYGGWKEPLNMGTVINSEKADFAPFIGSDNRFLFFCSYGHNGLGGSDIFMSVRLDNSWLNWSTPINLGQGINSNQEETYFSITGDYKHLYYTSYRSTAKDRNISRVELPEDFLTLHGPVLAVLDSSSFLEVMESQTGISLLVQAPVDTIIISEEVALIEEQAMETEVEQEEVIEEGIAMETEVEPKEVIGGVIAMEIEKVMGEDFTTKVADNSSPAVKNSDKNTQGLSAAAEEVRNYLQAAFPELTLEVRQKQDTVEFKIVENLLYEFNSVYVKSEYLQRISKMARILRERPELKVQLMGHTDNVGSIEVNKRIARQRVINLVEYFKDRRINPERIEVIGAGLIDPVASNDSTEGRMENRRVETVIRFIEK